MWRINMQRESFRNILQVGLQASLNPSLYRQKVSKNNKKNIPLNNVNLNLRASGYDCLHKLGGVTLQQVTSSDFLTGKHKTCKWKFKAGKGFKKTLFNKPVQHEGIEHCATISLALRGSKYLPPASDTYFPKYWAECHKTESKPASLTKRTKDPAVQTSFPFSLTPYIQLDL